MSKAKKPGTLKPKPGTPKKPVTTTTDDEGPGPKPPTPPPVGPPPGS